MNNLISEVTNEDCMEMMSRYEDNFFDLAIVDVPYGISVDEWMAKDSNTQRGKSITKRGEYVSKNWDKETPNIDYWESLLRVSKNQIIWGANHFISKIPFNSSCWIVWNKKNGDNGYSDCELAWTSFNTAVRMFEYKWHGMLQENMKNKEKRIHPTQKPVALYKWLLSEYALPNQKILDTHLGSQSSRIAAYDMGFDFWGCELDKEYFEQGNKRFEQFKSQLKLF